MVKTTKSKPNGQTELERLKSENEYLRTENAYLKKLRELRLKAEAKQGRKQKQ